MSDVTATLNPFGEHFLLDPYSSFELARQKSPVVYLPELDMMDTSDVLSPMAMEIIDRRSITEPSRPVASTS